MNIFDLLNVLRKYLLLELAILVAVTGGITWAVKSETPVYTASTQVFVRLQTQSTDLGSVNSDSQAIQRQMSTYTSLVKTESVLQPVIDNLGLDMTTEELAANVAAAANGDTTLMTISANSSDPKEAAQIANEVATTLNNLIINNLYTDDGGKLTTPIKFSVVQKAYAPATPTSPNAKSGAFKGALAGFVLAVVVALALNFMDKKIRQVSDIQAYVKAPVIGNLPKNQLLAGSAPAIVAQPAGVIAEDIRRVAVNLSFVIPKDMVGGNLVVVSSGGPNEGKSTLAVNLAAAYAEKGEKVLLVDADLRKPSIGRYLGVNDAVGLTNLATGQVEADTAIQRYWKEGFHVLPSGAKSPNPSLLLGSKTMLALLERFSIEYDHVIVDTSPMDVANDAAIFAKEGARLVLVVGQNVATKKSLRGVAAELDMVDVPVMGVVVNYAEAGKRSKSKYYYYAADASQTGEAGASGSKAGKPGKGHTHRKDAE